MTAPIEEATLIHRDGVAYDHHDKPVTGVVVVRDEGRISEKGPYTNGKREGPWAVFHDSGRLSYNVDVRKRDKDGDVQVQSMDDESL